MSYEDYAFNNLPERASCRCRICDVLTTNTGTKLCDNCWEIEHRLRRADQKMLLHFLGMILLRLITKFNAIDDVKSVVSTTDIERD